MLFALATPLVLTQGLASDDYKGRLRCRIQASLCSQLTQVAVQKLSLAIPLPFERGYRAHHACHKAADDQQVPQGSF